VAGRCCSDSQATSQKLNRLRRFYAAQRLPWSFPGAQHRSCTAIALAVTAGAATCFAVSARGLEAGVHLEMGRRGLDAGGWKEIHGEVISININALCSPGKHTAAEAAGKKRSI